MDLGPQATRAPPAASDHREPWADSVPLEEADGQGAGTGALAFRVPSQESYQEWISQDSQDSKLMQDAFAGSLVMRTPRSSPSCDAFGELKPVGSEAMEASRALRSAHALDLRSSAVGRPSLHQWLESVAEERSRKVRGRSRRAGSKLGLSRKRTQGFACRKRMSTTRGPPHATSEECALPAVKRQKSDDFLAPALQASPRPEALLAKTRPGQMPEASEEDWERREAARTVDIAIGKESVEYRAYIDEVPRDQRWESAPKTPDAWDRTVSRRRWKADVHDWRKRSRAWYLAREESSELLRRIAANEASAELPEDLRTDDGFSD